MLKSNSEIVLKLNNKMFSLNNQLLKKILILNISLFIHLFIQFLTLKDIMSLSGG